MQALVSATITVERTPRPLTRREKAQRIIDNGGIELTAIPGVYLIQSEFDPIVWYQVDTQALTCECPDRARGNHCKHLIAAQMAEQKKRSDALRKATPAPTPKPKRTEWVEELDLI